MEGDEDENVHVEAVDVHTELADGMDSEAVLGAGGPLGTEKSVVVDSEPLIRPLEEEEENRGRPAIASETVVGAPVSGGNTLPKLNDAEQFVFFAKEEVATKPSPVSVLEKSRMQEPQLVDPVLARQVVPPKVNDGETLTLTFGDPFRHGTMEEDDIRVLYPVRVETTMKLFRPYRDFVINRRFKEFKALYNSIAPMATFPLPPHPKKSFFHRFDKKIVDGRRDGFHEILAAAVGDTKIRNSAALIEFLTPTPLDLKMCPLNVRGSK